MIIECCQTNVSHEWVEALATRFPQATIVTYPCLNRCAGCFLAPFVLLDGLPLEAWSLDQLYRMIEETAP